MFLEVSNVCDLSCVMCPTFSAINPDRKTAIRMHDPGFLKADEVFKAVGPLLERALVVHAFGYGEPTIHPSFASFLAHLSQYEALVDFFTNGMHLTDGLVEHLVNLSIHHVTVSFSGSTKQDYESVYQGGKFEVVLAGLARLRDRKRTCGSRFPRVHIHSLSFDHHLRRLDDFVELMTVHGVDEIEVTPLVEHAMLPAMTGHASDTRSPEIRSAVERAQEIAASRGVTLFVHPDLQPSADVCPDPERMILEAPRVPVSQFQEAAAQLSEKPLAPVPPDPPALDPDRESLDEIRRRLGIGQMALATNFVCLEPFKTFYLRRGGQVKTCCYMRDDAPGLGDIRRESGEKIWNADPFGLFRSSVLAGQYPAHACGSCLANRLAPNEHLLEKMLRDYADWHPDAQGYPFDLDTRATLIPVRTGEQIAAHHWARRPSASSGPGAEQRLSRLLALMEGVTRLEKPHTALVEGWVDHVSDRGVAGWAWSPIYPDLRLPVSVWKNGRKIADLIACKFRPDLATMGKGDGRFGFAFPFGGVVAWKPGDAVRVNLGKTRCEIGFHRNAIS
ncbi:MAG TPA: radical SAM protein [Thermoanaerobaculia bacterium]|nr:radical SAM protein [Thermoanaerobaculia bacterium]